MDSPQLLHLAFLLLALAAPCPSIAMSTGGPAEGTEDYSTEVTIYRCKDCNSCTCKIWGNDFEKFKIITGTQNKVFPDLLIELVTNETHSTVCFEEPNSCLKETYGIYWQRAGRPGLACGSLSSGENGRGSISTEMKTICCEAETGTRKYNPELKCFYSQQSHPKLNTLWADIPGEGVPGNPEFLTSKKNSTDMWIGILFASLFGVCTILATVYYCLQLRRHGQAFRQCRQTTEGDVVRLDREPSTREETPLTPASSSLSECTATS